MSLYRIGVDVGGTNTDAVILDINASDSPGRGVLASHKGPTTDDITSGIESSIRAVLQQSGVDRHRVLSVTIGTTQFINALVEADARRLDRIAVVRLCGPFTRQLPPFSDFPIGLRGVLDGGVHYLDGGLEIDGREILPLDPQQIRLAAREISQSGISVVALLGVFSPLDYEGKHEIRCKEIIQQEAPGLSVVCSHDIGPVGFLERENATILNGAILRTARKVITGYERAMARLGLGCPLYLSQNNGTLIDADTAAEYPIKTFASGPTNSMTGAAFLAGVDSMSGLNLTDNEEEAGSVAPQILVVDIGGTTTDVCALQPSGLPRQAPGFVEVGGVRTAFSIPEVRSIGLGGGSRVFVDGATGDVTVGPDSVGHHLMQEAKIFGGSTLTSTDVIIALGKRQLGDPTLVDDIPPSTLHEASRQIKRLIENVVDQMRVSSAPVHVILVGGGALLVTEDLAGVETCTQTIHNGAANAVGAAIAKVCGEIDIVETLNGRSEKDVMEAARMRTIDLAVQRGAAREDTRIVEVHKTPLQYMDEGAMRIQMLAVGSLTIPSELTPPPSPAPGIEMLSNEATDSPKVRIKNALEPSTKPSLKVDLASYRPEVVSGVWYVSEVDLELISTGCGVLGTGGGGSTHHEYLRSLHALRSHARGRMRIISPSALRDDGMACFGSWYGAPSVFNERIPGGDEITAGIEAIKQVMGLSSFDGIFTDEIGGGNGMSAFATGAYLDVPVIDGDAMGRAFPTMYHATLSVYGHPLTPCVVTDARGNMNVVMSTDAPTRLEKLLRSAAIEMGLGCAVCARPLPGSAVKAHGVPNTLSLAWYLGRAIHLSRRSKIDFIDAIFSVCAGRLLFRGKIVEVRRYVDGGYTMGSVIIGPDTDNQATTGAQHPVQKSGDTSHMTIPFQNEYLYAACSDSSGTEDSQKVVCTVPDLISILGQDGEAIGSQDLRYGLAVSVIALPAHRLWKSEEGLKIGGPAGFGLKTPVVSLDDSFVETLSVIDEFGR